VVFEGYVSEEKTTERIPDVVIVNSRSEERIMTDRSGRFRIEARANDTLVFSRPGYGYRYQAARNADSVRVTLPPRNYLLEEVPVTAYKLTSNLPRDIDIKEPDRPSGSAIKIPQAKAPTLANPVDFLYDQFGNRPRQMRELTLLLSSDQYATSWRRAETGMRFLSLPVLPKPASKKFCSFATTIKVPLGRPPTSNSWSA